MATPNLKQRVGKSEGVTKNVWDFLDKNWQIVAIILGIVAIMVWYQALGLGTSVQKALNDVSKGVKETASNITPPAPPAPSASKNPETPQSAKPAGDYTQVAKKGQGVTHLARQALSSYLTSAKPQMSLSREQKVYIEDYLKDQATLRHLAVGQKLAFSSDSISKGIELSQKLSPAKLKNLTKYANRVPSLRAYNYAK